MSDNFHCGFISIIGEPNAGKSSLLNHLIAKKVAIVTNKPQTTRDQIFAILDTNFMQAIFIDTPGFHKNQNYLDKLMNKKTVNASKTADIICFLLPANKDFDINNEHLIRIIKEREATKFLLITKTDLITKEQLYQKINIWKDLADFKEIIPLSVINNLNIELLKNKLYEYLPNASKLYYEDNSLNKETVFLQDIIREKIILLTRQEMPYSVAVKIENFQDKKKLIIIDAVVIVERKSQKPIIIGKNGKMLKTIGMKARTELEDFFQKKVLLNLFVKVIDDWRNDPKKLKELNY